VEYARNPRKNDHAVDKVAAAIREFGFRVPIVAKSDGTIVDGHLRFKAARKLGLDAVPVLLADDMSEAQIKAFRISVNKVAELAEWDDELLMLELSELQESEFDLGLIGFDDNELDTLLKALNDEPGELLGDEDEVPEAPTQPVTVLGDTWLLGKHRVRCGDSTSITDIDALMMGRKADMCFTDPPYGVDYEGGHFHSGDVSIKRKREKLANDDSEEIYEQVIPVIAANVDGPCYTWFSGNKPISLFKAVSFVGEIHNMLIWHKTNAKYAAINAQYKQRHEPCLYWKPKGSTLRWSGPTTECTVWEMKRDAKNDYHPTQKPVELAERAIGNHNAKLVLDPFLGSGSTLIAAEKAGRECYGMELNPVYCDVIVKRWQSLTGKQATLESTGQTFAQVESERL
jgi:DNA modification methylase